VHSTQITHGERCDTSVSKTLATRSDALQANPKKVLTNHRICNCRFCTQWDIQYMSKTKLEIDIATIRRLTAIDTGYLLLWAERQCDLCQFTGFARWLHEAIGDEVVRRTDPQAEPAMLSLPIDWDGQTISDAMMGSYILCHHPCTEGVAAFADELHLRCLAYASSVLSEIQVSYR
jgi:hypothetical protein